MTDSDKMTNSDNSVPVEGRPVRVGRRRLMLGAAAAGAGAAVGLVAGAGPASAAPDANGGAVKLGDSNKATATTSVTTTAGDGLQGISSAGGGFAGVNGVDNSSGAAGVSGTSTNGTGVSGTSTNGIGVSGSSTAGAGVIGTTSATFSGSGEQAGVFGSSTGTNGVGVFGQGEVGVFGTTSTNLTTGVSGLDESPEGGFGVAAGSDHGTALIARGNAEVTGTLSKGGGSFKIDHPLDPAGKYLYHSFVESPDMMNVYNGNVTLDGAGKATVQLPDWFEALNRDFRYQLTAIGSAAPNLHVSQEVNHGRFRIAGGRAGQKVSWQVTGIRQDAWANANRVPVEADKPAEDRGRYLHPDLFGGEPLVKLARLHRPRSA
jgi:hypothetical protein